MEFRAEKKLIEIIKNKKNVEFIYNSNVTKLNGSDKLESIEVTNNKDEKKVINVSGLFVAIGRIPENENFRNIITLDNNGYVISNENCNTNIPGIFVAGDVRQKNLRQLVTATNDGAIAATSAIYYLNNK